MGVDQYALMTITDAQQALDLTAAEVADALPWLERAIDSLSQTIEKLCGRQFIARSYTENLHGTGTETLALAHRPVNSVTSIVTVSGAGSSETTSAVDATTYRVDTDAGIIELLDGIWARGFRNVRIVYNAGYTTVPYGVLQIAREVLAEYWEGRNRSPAFQSESLGDYSYTRRSPEDHEKYWAQRLAPWRRCPIGAARP